MVTWYIRAGNETKQTTTTPRAVTGWAVVYSTPSSAIRHGRFS
jgi:hypothetical protein